MEEKNLFTYLVSNEQVLRTSVLEVERVDQICSPLLGSVNSLPCKTCDQVLECGGHHGHLVLAVPVPKIFFLKHLVTVLNKLCMQCFELLHPNAATCTVCHSSPIVFAVKQSGVLFRAVKNPDRLKIGFDLIYQRLCKLNSAQVQALGFVAPNHPASFFWKYLLVPAINTRPQSTDVQSRSSVSDVTHHYVQIFKANAVLKQHLQSTSFEDIEVESESSAKELYLGLTKTIASAHSEKYRNCGQVSTKYCPSKNSIDSFFKGGKTGLLRANIGARRQDSQATRGVLEGDIYCPLDVITIPVVVAMALTVPLHITKHNIEQAQQYLINGPFKYPGANFALTREGNTIDLEFVDNVRDVRMEEIVCVYRHVVNGDVLVANRQPTLHRGSTIALFARVCSSQGPVFSIHPSLFPPLAADCDGDEINISSPQTLAAICEAKQLASPHEHLMKDGTLSIRLIQNAVIGLYVLSRMPELSVDLAVQFVIAFDGWPNFPQGIERVSGFDVFLHLLPADFYCHVPSESFLLNKGQHVSGYLNKITLNGPRGVIDSLYRTYGSDSVYKFIFESCILAQEVLDCTGCSVGVFDMLVAKNEMHRQPEFTHTLNSLALRAKEIPSQTEVQLRQEFSNSLLSVQSQLLHVLENRSNANDNGCLVCIRSGAKGTAGILTQVACFVGQIYSLHQRLPLIHSNSVNSLQNKGFCVDSYGRGVSLYTWVRESLSTAESLVDKNKGTGRVGYCFRKMIMALAPLTVAFDQTVCDSNDHVLSERFGDGMDPHKLTKNVIQRAADKTHIITSASTDARFSNVLTKLSVAAAQKLKQMDSFLLELVQKFDRWTEGKCAESIAVYFPLRLDDLFERFRLPDSTFSDAEQVVMTLSKFWSSFHSTFEVFTKNVTLMLLLANFFNVPTVLFKFHLNAASLNSIISILKWSVHNAVVQPGEAVGILTSQGIGEPFTQMNLTVSAEGNVSASNKGMQNIVDGNFNGCGMEIVLQANISYVDAVVFAKSLLCTPFQQLLSQFPVIVPHGQGSKGSIFLSTSKLIAHCVTPTQVCLLVSKKLQIKLENLHYPEWNLEDLELEIRLACLRPAHDVQMDLTDLFFSSKLEGISGIESASCKWAKSTLGIDNRWVVSTDGSNLSAVIVLPEVDPRLTFSYDCRQMMEVFGAFIAYKSLQLQMREALNHKVSDAFTDIISRFMFCGGFLHGMKTGSSSRISPALQAAAFEGAPKNLTDACALGLVDNASTVVTAAFANTPIKKGTGYNVKVKFPNLTTGHVVGLSKKLCEYVVSPKADGVRVLLVFTTDAEGRHCCALLDRSNSVYRLPVSHIGLSDVFSGTVFDCELVDASVQYESPLLLVFDVFASCGNVTSTLRYDQRISIAHSLLLDISHQHTYFQLPSRVHCNVLPCVPPLIDSQDRIKVYKVGQMDFQLALKPVFKMPKSELDLHVVTSTSMFPVDGVLFTDCFAEATPFLTNPLQSFKLKIKTGPLDPNTIDFHVAKKDSCPVNFLFSPSAEHDAHLCVLKNSKLVAVASANMYFKAKFGEVWECAYDTSQQRWKFVKQRHKKPNTFIVAQRNMDLILHPLEPKHLINLIHLGA